MRSCRADVDNRYDVELKAGTKLEWWGGDSQGTEYKLADGRRVTVSREDDKCVKKIAHAKDAIQHIAVEPIIGGLKTRVMHGNNTAERAGFASKKRAQQWGERTLEKLGKQAEAQPKFRSWKIAPQAIEHTPCTKCGQVIAVVEGKIAPHTRPWLYGVQKNYKVDPSNKKYQCKGTGMPITAEAKDALTPMMRGAWTRAVNEKARANNAHQFKIIDGPSDMLIATSKVRTTEKKPFGYWEYGYYDKHTAEGVVYDKPTSM